MKNPTDSEVSWTMLFINFFFFFFRLRNMLFLTKINKKRYLFIQNLLIASTHQLSWVHLRINIRFVRTLKWRALYEVLIEFQIHCVYKSPHAGSQQPSRGVILPCVYPKLLSCQFINYIHSPTYNAFGKKNQVSRYVFDDQETNLQPCTARSKLHTFINVTLTNYKLARI